LSRAPEGKKDCYGTLFRKAFQKNMSNPPSWPSAPQFGSLLSVLATLPENPSKWTKGFKQRVTERFDKRLSLLQERIDAVVKGRVVPDIDDLSIGTGTQHQLSILFLDICGFSQLLNWQPEDQKSVLALMNVFMSEMISLVRDFEGHFEKNTGDGLMAYFGEGAKTDAERVKPAVEAATAMHYFNDHILGPVLDSIKVPRLRFRIGIDVGPVTLARVGVKSGDSNYSSIVAIGTIANVACKLMTLIPDGGICVGQYAYNNLPNNWASRCTKSELSTSFVYVATQRPYPAWVLDYRLTEPAF
jgi:adenylate cyclase